MSYNIDEIREKLIQEFYEDEDMIKQLSDKDIIKLWRVVSKKMNKRRTDVWEWDVKKVDISEAKSMPSNVVVEIRGVVQRVFRPSEYLGCPIHRTKVREINGEYYCSKCGEPVSPVTFRIRKFIISDDTGEIFVSTFPAYDDELGDNEKNISEEDFVAVRGSVKSSEYGMFFDARGFRVILKSKRAKKNKAKMKSNVRNIEKEEVVEKEYANNEMSEEEQVMFDVIRYKLSSLLRRKDYLKYSQIKFVVRDNFDVNEFIEKFFDEVMAENGAGVVYKLKDKYKKMLEEEGLL